MSESVEVLSPQEKDQLRDQLDALIRTRHLRDVRRLLEQLLDPDIAELLAQLDEDTRIVAFHLVPKEHAPSVFTFLSTDQQENLIDNLRGDRLETLINEMEPDDRSLLLDELPEEFTDRLLSLINPKDRAETEQILSYPPESIARNITSAYIAVEETLTVEETLAVIRKEGADAEILNIIYVVDKSHHLVDYIFLRDILLAQPGERIASLLDQNYVSLKATEDREQAVLLMGRYDLPALPIIDDSNTLLGIVTFDDVADIAEQEATEDFHKGGGMAPLDTRYRDAGIFSLFSKRVVWLLVLVIVNLLSSGVIAAYEETLAKVVSLAFFIPLLIDSGGNTGSQSAVLLIRALATGEMRLSQWGRALTKELGVGIVLGVALGLSSALLGFYRGGVEIGIIVGTSMCCIVIISNLIGAILPFILLAVRIDPAVAGSPLITSLADSSGLLIYFSIATFVLSHEQYFH